MSHLQLSIQHEKWPLNEPFRISRGVRNEAQVVAVTLTKAFGGGTGAISAQAESCPYPRYGETVASVIEQLQHCETPIGDGLTNQSLQALLPAGAARNALDCALWQLRCKETGSDLWQHLNVPKPETLATAMTIGIDSAEAMAAKGKVFKDYPLIKVKLDREDIQHRVRRIRDNAPNARIIIDANESWDIDTLREIEPLLVDCHIAMLEQPLPVGQDEALALFKSRVPIGADESCHTSSDLNKLRGKYQVINIKLDKTGGLTEALRLKRQAIAMGFDIMVGCMLGTSLAMAPAMVLTQDASFVDLDGPTWLIHDKEPRLLIRNGIIVLSDAC